MSFDVGWVSEELASQQIHFCHMAFPVLFSFQITKKVGSGDKRSHHLPDVYYSVMKELTTMWAATNIWLGVEEVCYILGLPVLGKANTCEFSPHLGCILCFSAVCHAVITHPTNNLRSSLSFKFAIVLLLQYFFRKKRRLRVCVSKHTPRGILCVPLIPWTCNFRCCIQGWRVKDYFFGPILYNLQCY